MPTFLFADLAGFTAITEAHGDADASELAREFTLSLFAITAECGEFPTDPVCRLRLAEAEGVGSVRFEGRVYHFCSLDCTARFSAKPDAYVTERN